MNSRGPSPGFSLIELLVSISIIALLTGLMLPALSGARGAGRLTSCLSNQRQLALGWTNYANVSKDRAMPLAYWTNADIEAVNAIFGTVGSTEQVFWWGSHGTSTAPVDYARGFIAPYLDAGLSPRSVFECADQPWESYQPQGPSGSITSTYGYNGYYLSPAKTPGWGATIGFRPWRRLFEINQPSDVFVFADTMLDFPILTNCALLDPPRLFSAHTWHTNGSPTTCFRHGRKNQSPGSTLAASADGSVRGYKAQPSWLTSPDAAIGSVETTNAPHYVPDAADWR
jgi:prepilin-type N-terminal cleavage/methylation domain-containing protein